MFKTTQENTRLTFLQQEEDRIARILESLLIRKNKLKLPDCETVERVLNQKPQELKAAYVRMIERISRSTTALSDWEALGILPIMTHTPGKNNFVSGNTHVRFMESFNPLDLGDWEAVIRRQFHLATQRVDASGTNAIQFGKNVRIFTSPSNEREVWMALAGLKGLSEVHIRHLVHELIHIHHSEKRTISYLLELWMTNFMGIIENIPLRETHATLLELMPIGDLNSRKERLMQHVIAYIEKHYNIKEKHLVPAAVEQIFQANALGIGTVELGKLIGTCHWDEQKHRYEPLGTSIDLTSIGYGIKAEQQDDILQRLVGIYRLYRMIENLKAVIIALEEMKKYLDLEAFRNSVAQVRISTQAGLNKLS